MEDKGRNADAREHLADVDLGIHAGERHGRGRAC
jgi:hypothetical protein